MMVPMFVKILLFYVLEITIIEVTGERVKITDFHISQVPNEYIGYIKYSLRELDLDSTGITMTFPILKKIDSNLKVMINMSYNNVPIVRGLILTFCGAFNNHKLLKPVLNKFHPYEKNTRHCPLMPGNWKLIDYVIDANDHCPFRIAPGGEYQIQIYFGESMLNPYVIIEGTGIVKGLPDPFFGLTKLLSFK